MTDCLKLLSGVAKSFPERVAVIDGQRRITYQEFNNFIAKISHYLVAKREKPRVALAAEQGVEAYAVIIAVLNVGGIYCPLDINAPFGRQLAIIEEFDPDVIIIGRSAKHSEAHLPNSVRIDSILSGEDSSPIERTYDDDDIAYVIYTSGTTGKSKGVKICRKALNKFLEWSIPTYNASEGDIWGQYSPLSFDLSIVDIFTCLCSGATLYAMNDIAAKKNRPAGIIEDAGITIWHSVPSAVEFMIVNERAKAYDFSSIRLMSFCGEPLRKHQVEFLFEKKAGVVLFNTYGPTEGTLFCTCQELTANSYRDFCDITMSIGEAIPGWALRLEPVEGGTEKEVVIYGNFIGKGYLGTVSDCKFRTIEVDGEMVPAFSTGDLVRETRGSLYFSCRMDRQVKVKGFRVELDEIDLRVREYLGIPCATVLRNGTLYTFVECESEIDAGLREYLKRTLEAYKIPNNFYGIKSLPRSQNQKIDIKALIGLLP